MGALGYMTAWQVSLPGTEPSGKLAYTECARYVTDLRDGLCTMREQDTCRGLTHLYWSSLRPLPLCRAHAEQCRQFQIASLGVHLTGGYYDHARARVDVRKAVMSIDYGAGHTQTVYEEAETPPTQWRRTSDDQG
jgi:hypothetical protein